MSLPPSPTNRRRDVLKRTAVRVGVLFAFGLCSIFQPTVAFHTARHLGRRPALTRRTRNVPCRRLHAFNPIKDQPEIVASDDIFERLALNFVNNQEEDPTRSLQSYYEAISALRVGIPALAWATLSHLSYPVASMALATAIDDSGVFAVVSQDSSQYIQNILTTSGLVFSIIAGQTFCKLPCAAY
jgi:hypothetical protein